MKRQPSEDNTPPHDPLLYFQLALELVQLPAAQMPSAMTIADYLSFVRKAETENFSKCIPTTILCRTPS